MRKIKTTMSFVLGNRLPPDIVQHISDMAAATHVQAFARGMLARIRRMPACRFGFEQFDEGAYRYVGCDFDGDLARWTAAFRPGAYSASITVTYTDGMLTIIGPQRLLVTPSGLCWSLIGDWQMYSLAFVPCHGQPCEYHIHVSHEGT